MNDQPRRKIGISGRIAAAFQDNKLTPLLVVTAVVLGLFATAITPREEEPQIVVPMVDVMVQSMGLDAAEIEQLVTTPMETMLGEIPGVEHVYSMSRSNVSMAIVRFEVGQDEEDSLVKVYDKLHGNIDRIPIGVTTPVIKLRSIDDVPVMAVTFHSPRYGHETLRRVGAEVATELKKVQDVSEVTLIGGQRRQVRVELDPQRLEAYMLSPLQVFEAIQQGNTNLPAGAFERGDVRFEVEVGDFFRSASEVGQSVVAVYDQRPVRLADVATVTDGAAEIGDYVLHRDGAGAAFAREHTERGPNLGRIAEPTPARQNIEANWPFADEPAVTLAIAKRRGANATDLTAVLQQRLRGLEGSVIVSDVDYTLTRDYGFSAEEKSDELIFHMGLATISVVFLMGIFLGIKEALVVAVAVPVTLALTLFSSYFFGYTLNRVTLFALIFAIGILVDDAIVVVENIHRHYLMRWGKLDVITPVATDEVGNPTILATLTVIFALMPLAFVSGMMGPYMSPIPINASAAMFFSLVVAFVVTPWLTRLLLSASERLRERRGQPAPDGHGHDDSAGLIGRAYRGVMGPLVRRPLLRAAALLGTVALLAGSTYLVYDRSVKVKMLPNDNKPEFQIVIDLDEGATLERTAAVTREIAEIVARDPHVRDVQLYVGTSAPINFNGLVRHYFLRRGAHLADIQVNLIDKHLRTEQSHDIAKRLRPAIAEIGKRHGAAVLVAEVPPGPPVWSTMLAEIYGPDLEGQREVARQVMAIYEQTDGIVDVDLMVESPAPRYALEVDKVKAALSGVNTQQITHTIGLALHGKAAGLLHTPTEREPIEVHVQVPDAMTSSIEALADIKVHGENGRLVPIRALVRERRETVSPTIHHKDMRRVVYVTAEVAGADESPVYGILDMGPAIDAIRAPDGTPVAQLFAGMPQSESGYTLKWDGEWQITYEVFRDMGIAFAVVMLLIYILVVAWFRSFITPLIIMAPIPLTLIGILPGHWLTGTFFTATSMIGFIALAGIIVRNSILLVDFIEQQISEGSTLEEAVLQAGAIRFRPIFLTAAALVVGGAVILLDPIFSGLAVSLIFGVVISTALTLVVIPLLYYMFKRAIGGQAGAVA